MPDFSQNTNKEIIKMKKANNVNLGTENKPYNVSLNIIETSIQKLAITIDGKPATYKAYLDYNALQLQNY